MSLQSIRENMTGWILYVIVGLICVPFVLWGLGQYAPGGNANAIARVNGIEVNTGKFADTFNRRKKDYIAQFRKAAGNDFDPDSIDTAALKDGVLQGFIRDYVLISWVKDKDISAGYKQANEDISSNPMFQDDAGNFSIEKRNQFLRGNNIGLKYYLDTYVKTRLELEALQKGIVDTAFMTDQEIQRIESFLKQERKFRFIKFDRSSFVNEVKLTEEELKKYYEANKDSYKSDVKVKLEYVELSADTLKDKLVFSDEEIEKQYNEKKETYKHPEQRKFSHILVKLSESASEEAVSAAKTKAEKIYEELEKGADFAKTAKEKSDDPGTASIGGNIGYISKNGAAEKEFEDAAFALTKVGDFTKPVKTKYGFHIIKMTDLKEASVTELDKVKDKIKASLIADKFRDYLEKNSEELENKAYHSQDSLADVAKYAGVPVKETEFLSQKDRKGVFVHRAVSRAAFKEDLLESGLNSNMIKIGNNIAYFIRIKEQQNSDILPYEKVKQKIENTLSKERSIELAKTRAEEVKKAVSEGKDINSLSEELNFEITDAGFVSRENTKFSRDIINKAFSMGRPINGKVLVDVLEKYSGDFCVVILDEVKDKAVAIDEIEEDRADQISRSLSAKEFDRVIQAKKDMAEITIDEEILSKVE